MFFNAGVGQIGSLPLSFLNSGRSEVIGPVAAPAVAAPIVSTIIPAAPVPVPTPIVHPAPVYQFMPSVDFSNYNRVELQPKIEVEAPHTPAETYGPPAQTYGTPTLNLPTLNYPYAQ